MVSGNARLVLITLVPALLLTLLAAPVAAQTPCDSHAGRGADLHTREQLRQLVHCAAAHVEAVGQEQAALDFAGSEWREHPVYLFGTRADGTILFNPGSNLKPGDNIWDLQDPDGVYPSREQVRVSRDFGSGYVYLRFHNPATGQDDPVETYVRLTEFNGEPGYVGAAFYPQDTHATCSPDLVRASLVYSERDVERFVACAEYHLQRQGLQALHDFNTDPRWISGPTYLFLGDLETLYQIANPGQPHLVGTDGSLLIDSDGVNIGLEIQRILASHDDGYVYYSFPNPATGEPGYKASHVRRVLLDGRAYVLGAGLYVPAAECRDLPLARAIDTRDELQQYVRCAKDLVDERGALAWDLFLNHPQWIGGPTYLFVNDELCRQVLYPLDYKRAVDDSSRCHITDAEGTLLNQDLLDMSRSEAGEGWVRYLWQNPASDEVEAKHSFVVGATLAGEHIAIGAGLYESQLQTEAG